MSLTFFLSSLLSIYIPLLSWAPGNNSVLLKYATTHITIDWDTVHKLRPRLFPTFVINFLPLWSNFAPLQITPFLLHTFLTTMQGAYNWAENLDKTFKEHEYYKSCADPQICSRVIDEELMLTSTWIDNILEVSLTTAGEETAKAQLSSSYKIKDLGETTLILGMWIT